MSVQLLLEEADKLQHSNKVFLRDLTADEQAQVSDPDYGMLVCIIRPQYPQWARAEVFVDLNRVTEVEYRQEVLKIVQDILNQQFPSLLPQSQERSKRGEFKETLDVKNTSQRIQKHKPKQKKVEEVPLPPPEPAQEFTSEAPTPAADLAGKAVKKK